jgi:hypothetical protein
VSKWERDTIAAGLPSLAEKILDQGQLCGADLRKALGPNINLPNFFDKDELVQYCAHSVVLTHLDKLKREVKQKKEKAAGALSVAKL